MPAAYAVGTKYAGTYEPNACITKNKLTCLAFNTLVYDDE
jgi:hypothetical protein